MLRLNLQTVKQLLLLEEYSDNYRTSTFGSVQSVWFFTHSVRGSTLVVRI